MDFQRLKEGIVQRDVHLIQHEIGKLDFQQIKTNISNIDIEQVKAEITRDRLVLAGTIIGGFLVLRFFLTVVYRLYFHPLRNFPGPWIAKVSDIYPAWHNAMGRLHIISERDHKIYGPIYRQGPNKLVTNSPAALQEIYQSKDVQKSYGYATMVPSPGAYNIFTAINKETHRFKHRVLAHGFSDQKIRDFEPRIVHQVEIFLKRLITPPQKPLHSRDGSDGWSDDFNMTECCRHLGYDIMGEFGFGQSFNLQTSDKNYFLIDAVTATVRKASVYVQFPELQKLHLELLFFYSGMKMRQKYLNLMSGLVSSRVAEGKDAKNDLFSNLVDAKDPETGKGFSKDELWAESRFLLIAGADTSSTAMTSVFFYLTAYPECQAKLAQEIRSTFKSPSEIVSGPKLANCKYLRAVLDEAMRMSPPISSTLWREVIADDYAVDGKKIPKGVDIAINPYAFHHNEEIFPDSFTFNPERWIPSASNPKEAVDYQKSMFSVFSIGTRACAGRTMAYTELSISVARTLWYLDFKTADSTLEALRGGYYGASYGRHREKEFQLKEHMTCSHDGPVIRFKVRPGAEAEAQGLLSRQL